MKKRLLALIMAGLLTASLASCVATDDETGGGGTETTQNQGEPSGGGNTTPPVVTEFQDVDKTYYTLSKLSMREEAKESGKLVTTIPLESEVYCTKENSYWCYVTYGEFEGYVSRKNMTTIDILAKNFTPVPGGEKIMYVNDTGVRVRLYPSDTLTQSTVIKSLTRGDSVVVIATNDSWSQIKYTDDKGVEQKHFVFSKYLSADKQLDPNDESQWLSYFTECNPTLTKYTNAEKGLNLRKAPTTEADVLEVLGYGTTVTVHSTGTIGDTLWCKVEATIPPQKPGDGAYTAFGYVSAEYLSDEELAAPKTLDEIVAFYTGLQKVTETTLYASGSVNFRTTPNFTSDYKENIAGTLENKTPVTVVAAGIYNGNSCYVIRHKVENVEGFYFVYSTGLTIYEDGTPMLTLDTIRANYKDFEILDPAIATTVKIETANCYLKPENSKDVIETLAKDTNVIVVAIQSGTNPWCVVLLEDGQLLFISASALN